MKTLRDLGPGDEVAIIQRGWAARIVRIERVTATHIVTGHPHEDRWRRDTGAAVPYRSDPWAAHLAIVTDEHRAEAERERCIRAIERIGRDHDRVRLLSIDTLRTIAAALRADPATEGERG